MATVGLLPGGLTQPSVRQFGTFAIPPDRILPVGSTTISIPNPCLQENKGIPFAASDGTAAGSYALAAGKPPPPLFVTNLTTFHPIKRGNDTFLKMPDELYQQRLTAFNYALIGRIFLPKQSPPRAIPDLKSDLQRLFKTEQDWSLNPLGKGFFSLKFACQADLLRASSSTSWRLLTGSFHVRDWKPNFDPYKEQTSVTQIWVRLFHLPEEYWDPDFLVGIFRAVGNVVKLDGSTAAGVVGHFARALIEVDLSYPLAESVTIESATSCLVVEFGFENIPLFCSYCRFIGHSLTECRNKTRVEDITATKEKAVAGDAVPRRRRRHRWRRRWQEKDQPQLPISGTLNASMELNPDSDMAAAPAAAAAVEALKSKDFSMDHLGTMASGEESAPMPATSTSNAFEALQNTDAIEETVPSPVEGCLSHGNDDEDALGSASTKTKSGPDLSSTVQVPADSVGQAKSARVAPNSPHPITLDRHHTAYVLDPGKSGAFNVLNYIVPWGADVDLSLLQESDDDSIG